jgi:hypothetical protein
MQARDHWEELGVGGRIILNWMLRKEGWREWTKFIWLRAGPLAGSCEHSNEPSGTTKGK